MNVVAIIPARGGSKGVSRKNVQLLGGRPLLHYSIRTGLSARLINRTIVSTEDAEIARVALDEGAEVVDRPAGLATDDAPTDPVLEDVVLQLERRHGYTTDLIVLLQATSPLRPLGLVDDCITRLVDTGADSLLTVFEGPSFFWRRRGGRLEANYDPSDRPRRQDIHEQDRILLENGSVYVTRREILMGSHSRLGGKIECFVMSPEDSLEIDSHDDLRLVEQILAARTSQHGVRT